MLVDVLALVSREDALPPPEVDAQVADADRVEDERDVLEVREVLDEDRVEDELDVLEALDVLDELGDVPGDVLVVSPPVEVEDCATPAGSPPAEIARYVSVHCDSPAQCAAFAVDHGTAVLLLHVLAVAGPVAAATLPRVVGMPQSPVVVVSVASSAVAAGTAAAVAVAEDAD